MFIEKIAIFMLFLGPLVFFHELGHFLFARLFGVKVEVFSIGFGPKIFRRKWGDTEYAWSLIPLGGYVKMFGDDPLKKEEIPEEDRAKSFTHKSKWARFWIVFGGPLANFILAFFIFYSLLVVGERVPEIKLGLLSKTSLLKERGLLPGDVVKKINGVKINSPADIALEGGDLIKTVTVERIGSDETINLNVGVEEFFKEYAKSPPLRKPVVINNNGKEFALSFNEKSADLSVAIEELSLKNSNKRIFFFEVTRDKKGEIVLGNQTHFKDISFNTSYEFFEKLRLMNLRTLDLVVEKVQDESSAKRSGLSKNDVIVSLNDKPVISFEELRTGLQKTQGDSVYLTFWRKSEKKTIKVFPDVKKINGKPTKLIGVYSAGQFVAPKMVQSKSTGPIKAIGIAFHRTKNAIYKTVEGFGRLLTGEISFKDGVGGPIAIGKVANDSFNSSFSSFIQLMALLSISLGIINLFPIPVLDGGHIMFIFLEIISRGPLSRRKMEIAQQIGLSLLLLLIVGSLVNDITKFVDI